MKFYSCPYFCSCHIGFLCTNFSSTLKSNHLKFIHKVRDHKEKAIFDFPLCHFPFWNYVFVYHKLEAVASVTYGHIFTFFLKKFKDLVTYFVAVFALILSLTYPKAKFRKNFYLFEQILS
jgi:hypothetical protein